MNPSTKLFRVKIEDRTKRFQLLQNAKKLKDSDSLKNIFLSKGLTYNQREELRFKRARRRAIAESGSLANGIQNRDNNPSILPCPPPPSQSRSDVRASAVSVSSQQSFQ